MKYKDAYRLLDQLVFLCLRRNGHIEENMFRLRTNMVTVGITKILSGKYDQHGYKYGHIGDKCERIWDQ